MVRSDNDNAVSLEAVLVLGKYVHVGIEGRKYRVDGFEVADFLDALNVQLLPLGVASLDMAGLPVEIRPGHVIAGVDEA